MSKGIVLPSVRLLASLNSRSEKDRLKGKIRCAQQGHVYVKMRGINRPICRCCGEYRKEKT